MVSRSLSFALPILLASLSPADAAEPARGDVAVIGFHTDVPDAFAWVTLVDLDPGLALLFTDSGWIGGDLSGASTVSDSGLLYVVPAGGIPAGTVQLVPLADTLPAGYTRTLLPFGEMLGGTFGDQLAISRAHDDVFLFALNTNSSGWNVSMPNPNFATESELYPGLTDGVDAVAVGAGPDPGEEVDNAVYAGITRGTRDELIAAIARPENWNVSDDPLADITNGTLADGFDVLKSSTTDFLRGDCNGDGRLDISDPVCLLLVFFAGRPAPGCLAALNANGDGALDISDPTTLLLLLFSDGPPLPEPFPDCGPGTLEIDAELGCEVPPAGC